MKKWKIIAALILVAEIVRIFMVPSRPEPGTGRSADTSCRKLLAEKENSEALTWLK